MTISKINSKLSFSGVSDLHCETHLSNIALSNSKSESSDIADVPGDKFDKNSSISASNIFVFAGRCNLNAAKSSVNFSVNYGSQQST